MQNTNHQLMGYDRAITMFSPEGRLLQVEYAKKTVKQGSTAMGMACAEGVVFIVDKRIPNPLIKPESVEKIFEIDAHIATAASGIISDARVLIERAQMKAQQNRITYDVPMDVLPIVKDIASLKQYTTQSGGLRPFGVSMIIGGVDKLGPKLYLTDPTGIFFEYSAVAIGEFDTEAEEMLIKEFKQTMSIKDCLSLGVRILQKVQGDNFDVSRVDAAVISSKDKQFTRISQDQLR